MFLTISNSLRQEIINLICIYSLAIFVGLGELFGFKISLGDIRLPK